MTFVFYQQHGFLNKNLKQLKTIHKDSNNLNNLNFGRKMYFFSQNPFFIYLYFNEKISDFFIRSLVFHIKTYYDL
jgi:hypothetical protein